MKPVPINPANKTPNEVEEKVLYLRKKYHLGPIRIVWYLARYHGITVSEDGTIIRLPVDSEAIIYDHGL